MKEILIVGSGISGLYCACHAAKLGLHVTLLSPFIPERSQSVMAAGGINAALDNMGEQDSVVLHIEETLNGGCNIERRDIVQDLCSDAPEIIKELDSLGVIFNRTPNRVLAQREFGGQSKKRTVFAGTSTGKQIVTALVRKLREYQALGSVTFQTGYRFLCAFIDNGECYGGLFLDDKTGICQSFFADAMIMATGGQNRIFGKTTGSVLCDGSATAKLFMQGVTLRNLEFIQYHPTTIEAPGKRMLISEAARSEGGRLFYIGEGGERHYFMEEKYGKKGNLMPRDIVSKEVYDAPSQVYLDITFLDNNTINNRLYEIKTLCQDYIGLDVRKEPIPIYPSVHFFMGGIAVDRHHRTNIKHLYAIGECSSLYHGANRLGGNSLLSAIHSAKVAAEDCLTLEKNRLNQTQTKSFSEFAKTEEMKINQISSSPSKFPSVFIMKELARIMNEDLGITRTEKKLLSGISELDFYLDIVKHISFDGTISLYEIYALPGMLTLAKAITLAALERRESRGSQIRLDYPHQNSELECPTYVEYRNGNILVRHGEQ
jgi:succinate dehydrogenase / fumarate reductase flavoprotein subunit